MGRKKPKSKPYLEVRLGGLALVNPGVSLEPLAVDKLLDEETLVAVQTVHDRLLLELAKEHLKVGQEVRL